MKNYVPQQKHGKKKQEKQEVTTVRYKRVEKIPNMKGNLSKNMLHKVAIKKEMKITRTNEEVEFIYGAISDGNNDYNKGREHMGILTNRNIINNRQP